MCFTQPGLMCSRRAFSAHTEASMAYLDDPDNETKAKVDDEFSHAYRATPEGLRHLETYMKDLEQNPDKSRAYERTRIKYEDSVEYRKRMLNAVGLNPLSPIDGHLKMSFVNAMLRLKWAFKSETPQTAKVTHPSHERKPVTQNSIPPVDAETRERQLREADMMVSFGTPFLTAHMWKYCTQESLRSFNGVSTTGWSPGSEVHQKVMGEALLRVVEHRDFVYRNMGVIPPNFGEESVHIKPDDGHGERNFGQSISLFEQGRLFAYLFVAEGVLGTDYTDAHYQPTYHEVADLMSQQFYKASNKMNEWTDFEEGILEGFASATEK